MDGQGSGTPAAREWPPPPDWPDKPAGDMTDGELLAYGRQVYQRFRVLPGWANGHDDLLRRWCTVCTEMSARGMTDTVTEGGPVRDAVHLASEPDPPR